MAFIVTKVTTDPVSGRVLACEGTFTTAGDQMTPPVFLENGPFDLSIFGSFSGSLNVERSFDGGTTFRMVNSFTSPLETIDTAGGGALYRVVAGAGFSNISGAGARIQQT